MVAKYNAENLELLQKHAEFELECSSLKYDTLEQDSDGSVYSYGVSGCSKRTIYNLSPGGWIRSADIASTNELPPNSQ